MPCFDIDGTVLIVLHRWQIARQSPGSPGHREKRRRLFDLLPRLFLSGDVPARILNVDHIEFGEKSLEY